MLPKVKAHVMTDFNGEDLSSANEPVIVYGVNYVTAAGSRGMTFKYRPDPLVDAFTTLMSETRANAGNYTQTYGPKGILFPNGCRVTGTADSAAVFYTKLTNRTYGSQIPKINVRLTESGVLGSSGLPVVVYGLNAFSNGAGNTVKLYNGTSASGTLVTQDQFLATQDDSYTYPQGIIFPSGCYVAFGADMTECAIWYHNL